MPKLADYQDRLDEIPFDFAEMIGAIAPRKMLVIAPTRDSNFRADSVDRVTESAREVFNLLGKQNQLRVLHPNCAHDFPPEVREQAYQWIESTFVEN